MASAGYVLDTLTEMDRYLGVMTNSRNAAEIVAAVQAYLASWPPERVASVQTVDAGWSPFDEHQRPTPVFGAADVRQISDAVHAQCAALKATGVAPTPEFLELDRFFVIARSMLEGFGPVIPAADAATIRLRPGPQAFQV